MNALLSVVLLLIIGCAGTAPDLPASAAPVPAPSPAPTPEPQVPFLSWEPGHPERKAWSKMLFNLMKLDLLTAFDLAGDATRFCPNYHVLSRDQKSLVWAELIVWMSFYESNWNPTSHYKEPPPLGYDSIGLLQLSYEDSHYRFCDLNRAAKTLEDPIKNIDCGARIAALLISKYRAVTTTRNLGAAAYWSVLREGRKVTQIANHVGMLGFCE